MERNVVHLESRKSMAVGSVRSKALSTLLVVDCVMTWYIDTAYCSRGWGGGFRNFAQVGETGAHMKSVVVEDLEVKRRWGDPVFRPEELHLDFAVSRCSRQARSIHDETGATAAST